VLWIGLVVVGAHLLDLVEWMFCRVLGWTDNIRFLTHSVTHTTLVALLTCAAIRLTTRLRGAAFYGVLAIAVLSHFVLDQYPVRWFVADAYHVAHSEGLPDRARSIEAEVWLFGLPLVLVLLIQASRMSGVSRVGRLLSAVLAMGAVAAFATRSRWAWPPVYALCILHAMILGRRRLSWSMLWNITPMLVLAPLLAIELWAGHLFHAAHQQMIARDYDGAIETYRRAIALPARSSPSQYWIKLAVACRGANRMDESEAAYETAHAVEPHWWAAAYHLAMFRCDPTLRGTKYYRPEEAQRLYDHILVEDPSSVGRAYVRTIMAGLKNRLDSIAVEHNRSSQRKTATRP
jgi:hypothetical protein